MKKVRLEAGCYGINRVGDVIGPFRKQPNDNYLFTSNTSFGFRPLQRLFHANGKFFYDHEPRDKDIIRIIPKSYTLWIGGECPVFGGTVVNVIFLNGDKRKTTAASLEWEFDDHPTESDIVAYKVVKKKHC